MRSASRSSLLSADAMIRRRDSLRARHIITSTIAATASIEPPTTICATASAGSAGGPAVTRVAPSRAIEMLKVFWTTNVIVSRTSAERTLMRGDWNVVEPVL